MYPVLQIHYVHVLAVPLDPTMNVCMIYQPSLTDIDTDGWGIVPFTSRGSRSVLHTIPDPDPH